jgi:hypothetical protein
LSELEVASSQPPGCTSQVETANPGTVEALAAVLLGLSPADRARLAAMLLGEQSGHREQPRE